MSNTHFSFKKFTIHQERCAMKVGTDGVLLGAWANIAHCNNILDIGCGSGLISIMAAQRSKAHI
ncbi:MAG: methyltransferase, partial [Bacteroidaceae bacterium]|nr:methyltransferase [Bacteroidaceae bacterium]